MHQCQKCGKNLDAIEVGLYKKMVNRGATSFSCKECLSEMLGIPCDVLDKKVIEFQKWGCSLFPPYQPEEKEKQ